VVEELVVNVLTREALPAIRFRTDGLTRVISLERQDIPMNCSPHRRIDDMIMVKGVNSLPEQIE